jgi:hypothetical protein
LLTLYVKYYVIYLVKWKQWLVAPLIPWFGFIISSLIALCAKLPKNQVLTIAIETGIQNVGMCHENRVNLKNVFVNFYFSKVSHF